MPSFYSQHTQGLSKDSFAKRNDYSRLRHLLRRWANGEEFTPEDNTTLSVAINNLRTDALKHALEPRNTGTEGRCNRHPTDISKPQRVYQQFP